MNGYLLDVNVLIALIDPGHVHHGPAHDWFSRTGRKAFATCPLSENGLVRIVGHPKYPGSPGPPGEVVRSLVAIRALPGHRFWPDSLSIADVRHFAADSLTSHAQVTDRYLLALAHANGGRLATLDAGMAAQAERAGTQALELIAPS